MYMNVQSVIKPNKQEEQKWRNNEMEETLLTLSVGDIVKIKSYKEVCEKHGEGYIGVRDYEGEYFRIGAVFPDLGNYYMDDTHNIFGWDDRLVDKVEKPIAVLIDDGYGNLYTTKYSSLDDKEHFDRITRFEIYSIEELY